MNTITLTEFRKFKSLAEAEAALFADETISEVTDYAVDPQRGQLHQTVVTKSALTKAIIETATTEWTYKADKSVDKITTTKRNPLSVVTDVVTVKHPKDGQPYAETIAIAKEIPHG